MNPTELENTSQKEALKWLKSRMTIFVISVLVLLALAIAGLIAKLYNFTELLAIGIPAIVILELLHYRAITFWYEKFKYDPTDDVNDSTNPYRKVFFAGVNVLGVILLLTGFAGCFFIVTAGGEGAVYKATGMMVMIIWAVIFLRYFVWALYFYNINYGLTDKDWKKVFLAKKDRLLGKPISPGADVGNKENPYKEETFGLPPGTVRGMIAFTLLFGAIGLTIVSIGLRSEISGSSFFRDHYEFFKTAFLMMIAFYFGDSSLKTLSKRWNNGPQGTGPNTEPNTSETIKTQPSLTSTFSSEPLTPTSTPVETTSPTPVLPPLPGQEVSASPTDLKKQLEATVPEVAQPAKAPDLELMAEEFPQIADNEMSKLLNDDDYKEAADSLSNQGYEVQVAVIKAIVKVESSGSGFLDNGMAKILFEGHKFWHWLKEGGKDPKEYLFGNEDILYEKWTRQHYLGGAREYERLNRAMIIDQKAAIYSASWGKFQILGENLEHFIKSRIFDPNDDEHKKNPQLYYTDAMDFYRKQGESEYYHLLDFLAFITTKTVKNDEGTAVPLISFVSGSDPAGFKWDKFAYGYNGKGYKQNNYDTRLKEAYESFA